MALPPREWPRPMQRGMALRSRRATRSAAMSSKVWEGEWGDCAWLRRSTAMQRWEEQSWGRLQMPAQLVAEPSRPCAMRKGGEGEEEEEEWSDGYSNECRATGVGAGEGGDAKCRRGARRQPGAGAAAAAAARCSTQRCRDSLMEE